MDNVLNIGEAIPHWDIETINNEISVPSVEDYVGKPLIVLFFSLHCPGCLGRAIPFANRIVFENGELINVVGIHTHFEGPETSNEHLIQAKEEFHIRFPYFRDTGFASTFHAYQAGGTPHWIVVDKNGVVVDSIFGSDPNRALLKLDYLINELKQNN
jgi:thiol-disulfide isomerase/thioredoxin